MTGIGRLTDTDPRTAWAHEAHNFTPWLADNLDQLSEVIGIPLELQQAPEVPVVTAQGTYRADILARDPRDDTIVLIENQLETADFAHLGQIMIYLAGLDAKIVVWIATSFGDAALSAIKWLNEHTVDPFAFFAIRLRVVRIGDSPVAPIFEVLERPNDWERRLQASIRQGGALTEIGQFRRAFWQAFLDRHPDAASWGVKVTGVSSCWLEVEPPSALNVALRIASRGADVVYCGPRGGDADDFVARLSPIADRLATRLGVAAGSTCEFKDEIWADMTDETNWPRVIDWLHDRGPAYVKALREELGSETR